jgi:hypothetical protein
VGVHPFFHGGVPGLRPPELLPPRVTGQTVARRAARGTGGGLLIRRRDHPIQLPRCTPVAFPWTEVGAIATAAGAAAAWRAAGASREAVARAHRPFVWPEFDYDYEGAGPGETVWRVRLHNDGPGVALDVRWSVREIFDSRGLTASELQAAYDRADENTRKLASEPIRGMRAGQSVPPVGVDRWLTQPFPFGEYEWVAVRFTDSAGVRWEYSEPGEAGLLADPVVRLRRVRGYRGSWRWWLRRIRPRRPLRDWLSFRDRPDW